MRDLKGKTALVTGASRGLGVYLAKALADRGVHLAITARSAEGLERVKAELVPTGVQVLCVPADIGDRAALESLVDRTVQHFGSIDLLINNAGLDQSDLYPDCSRDRIEQIIDVNLTAPMLLTHRVLPGMLARGEGHVVNIASVAALAGVAYNEAYSATKHGLLGFTRSLATSAAGEGWPVGFSCILPGFVGDAGMYEQMKSRAGVAGPAISGVSAPEKVAAAMIKAIERNRLEVVVNPRPFKPLAIFLMLFPSAVGWVGRLTGAIPWFKTVARASRTEPPRDPQ